jgi:hypothetical protein
MTTSTTQTPETIQRSFEEKGVPVASSTVRYFPNETIYVVEVDPDHFSEAISIANAITEGLSEAFVTVKRAPAHATASAVGALTSLSDARVTTLIELLNARSRTSEQQPSLKYIKDAAAWVAVCKAPRHNLIFGRRGVGKTALMLEAKKQIESQGDCTFWMNIQSLRGLDAKRAFLNVVLRLCDLPTTVFQGRDRAPTSVDHAKDLRAKVSKLVESQSITSIRVSNIVPQTQYLLSQLNAEAQKAIYIFLDDFHYLAIEEQAKFLDLIHGITRDTQTWIKAAGIKHQSRWFTDNPPTGLQTTHDASIIDLDITLENPAKARTFLVEVLGTYAVESRLTNVKSAFSSSAIDRLVIASGGVPRDFLLLSANALQVARERERAKQTGVQDVNEAAGRASKAKLTELEEDAASSGTQAQTTLKILQDLRIFLLDEEKATYFRVEFVDKETHASEYSQLQALMDLRLVHLLNAGLSDEHHAGRRYEVYALDLSQFSGSRLKYNLKALDLLGSFLVLRSTGSKVPPKIGNTAKALQTILRRGPLLTLDRFSKHIA